MDFHMFFGLENQIFCDKLNAILGHPISQPWLGGCYKASHF